MVAPLNADLTGLPPAFLAIAECDILADCNDAFASKLEEGRGLGDCVRESGMMPDILTDMTAVGEETGELEATLHTIAGYYDAELEVAINAALAKMEPALLVGLGLVAGFIVIAIYIAMFDMYNAM